VQELAIAHGHRTPSYAAVARVVRAIPASQIAAASDPAVYRDQHELVHRREAATSNEMWQADHTVLDILVLDDAGTRCVLGPASSLTITAEPSPLLPQPRCPQCPQHGARLAAGVGASPIPNGSSAAFPNSFTSTTARISSPSISSRRASPQIRLIHSLPGRPRGRGKIERLFRTINDMFLPDLPGHLIAGKPLSAPVLTLDELRARFEAFVCGVYHRRPHGSTGEPPITRWQKGGFPQCPTALNSSTCCSCTCPSPVKCCATASV
jgi:putative transposase